MVIDWEHHYLPEELWIKKGGVEGETKIFYERGKPRGTLSPELYDIEEHMRVMGAVGIDMAVLSMAVTNDDTQIALEECRIWDDCAAKIVKKYPKRFVGLAPIPPLGGDQAFAELDRAIESLGLKGVVIRSQVSGLPLDSKELWPFFKKVSALNVPVFVHPSGVQMGFDILNTPYALDRTVGRELDLMVAIIRMVFSGVLDEFPELKLVFAHKGGGIAALKERIDHSLGYPGAVDGTRNCMPFERYLEKMYFDLAGHHGGMNSLKCALTCMKPAQLLFGTDYPQEFRKDPLQIKTYIENIKNLELNQESKDLILGVNAKKILNL